jgi:pimeloyl-ACP methyl ester carboxylesterase
LALTLAAGGVESNLPRGGLLGTQVTKVDEELQAALGLAENEGVQVMGVMPESAASAAGLLKDDVVLSVNGVAVAGSNVLGNFASTIGSYHGGDQVTLGVLRGDQRLGLVAELMPMPVESDPDFKTEYGHLTVDGNRHRTIVTRPKGDGPFPAVLFLQGLGCQPVDAWSNASDKLRQLLAGLTEAGFMTIRAEKRGVGDSEGAPCEEMDFQTELRGHRAALAYVQSLDSASDVFLFGHSMGGVFAPLVAADHDVAGVVVFGTIGKPIPVYYAETVERQLRLSGATDAFIEKQMKTCNDFISLFFGERLMPGEIADRDPRFASFLSNRDADATHFHGVHYTFWHQLDDIDKAEAWAKVSAPVLILYGAADYAASRDDHPYIRDAVNAAHPGSATYVELEGIGHGFETAASQLETMRNRFSGAFNPIVVETSVEWMRAQS